jgi:hypothetical protein
LNAFVFLLLAVECLPTSATAQYDMALWEEVLFNLHIGKVGITPFHFIFAGRFVFLCPFSGLPEIAGRRDDPVITHRSFP